MQESKVISECLSSVQTMQQPSALTLSLI